MKIDAFCVRDYRDDDFEAVRDLWDETGTGNPARGDDEKTIKASVDIGGKMLVMEKRATGRICGTSWMTFDGRRIHLHHFAILPQYQGKGLSKLLLNKSLDFVSSKGYQVKIEVHRSNTRAINLYRKAGFEYLGDYDVFMIRDLKKIRKL